jgi:hypothetical protein
VVLDDVIYGAVEDHEPRGIDETSENSSQDCSETMNQAEEKA